MCLQTLQVMKMKTGHTSAVLPEGTHRCLADHVIFPWPVHALWRMMTCPSKNTPMFVLFPQIKIFLCGIFCISLESEMNIMTHSEHRDWKRNTFSATELKPHIEKPVFQVGSYAYFTLRTNVWHTLPVQWVYHDIGEFYNFYWLHMFCMYLPLFSLSIHLLMNIRDDSNSRLF